MLTTNPYVEITTSKFNHAAHWANEHPGQTRYLTRYYALLRRRNKIRIPTTLGPTRWELVQDLKNHHIRQKYLYHHLGYRSIDNQWLQPLAGEQLR